MASEALERYYRAMALVGFRKKVYKMAFTPAAGKEVLRDLAKFCHVRAAPFHPDERRNDILVGRQEVFWRIANFLYLSEEEIYNLLDGRAKPTE